MKLIIVIGKGHSGTRVMAQTLYDSDVYMGELNASYDSIKEVDEAYEAAHECAHRVPYAGNYEWDFAKLFSEQPTEAFKEQILKYTGQIFEESHELCGWKLPEMNLCYPWLVNMFPNAYYIHWVRNPRDTLLKDHKSDYLNKFGINFTKKASFGKPRTRAISWKFHWDIVSKCPTPKHFIRVKLEDYVRNHDTTVTALSDFLGLPLKAVTPNPEPIDRWKNVAYHDFKFLFPAMEELGYDHSQPQVKPSEHYVV